MSKNKPDSSQIANQKNNDTQEKSNRSTCDRDRDKKTYKYLLTLVDDYLEDPDNVSISHVADQWGLSENRMFVSRVLKSMKDDSEAAPGLTLNKLVIAVPHRVQCIVHLE
jgi:hypothetical protein